MKTTPEGRSSITPELLEKLRSKMITIDSENGPIETLARINPEFEDSLYNWGLSDGTEILVEINNDEDLLDACKITIFGPQKGCTGEMIEADLVRWPSSLLRSGISEPLFVFAKAALFHDLKVRSDRMLSSFWRERLPFLTPDYHLSRIHL